MIKSSSIWQPVTAIQTRTFVELTPHNLFCYFGSTGKHDLLACRWLQDKTDKHLDNLNRFSQRQCLEWIFISEPSSLYIQGRELALCFWGVFNTLRKYNSAFTASYILFVFVLWGSFFNFENPRVENGQHYTLKLVKYSQWILIICIFFLVHIYLWVVSLALLGLWSAWILEWCSWSSLFSSEDFKSRCLHIFVLCMLWFATSNICLCPVSAFGQRPKTYRWDTEQDLLCSCMSSLVVMVMERWWNPGGWGRTESELKQR